MDRRNIQLFVLAILLSVSVQGICDSCSGQTSASINGTWESIGTGLFTPRHHPIAFSGNGSGYIMAGLDNVFDMHRFDPHTKKLTAFDVPAGSPKPVWRTFSYGISIGDIAYLGFGISADRTALRDWWKYDTVTNKFTELASLPSGAQPRWHPAVVPFQCDRGSGKEWFILVSCGSSPIGNLKDTWEYRVRDDTWTKRPDLPGAARHHPFYFDATINSNGDQYPFVGFGHAAFSDGYIKKDLYRYHPTQMSWTQVQDFPGEARVAGTEFSVRYDASTIRGYVLSGDGDNHGWMASGEMWEYDGQTDTWRSLPPHPGISRWAPGSFVIGCTVYLVGGYNRQTRAALGDIMSYPLGLPPCATSVGGGGGQTAASATSSRSEEGSSSQLGLQSSFHAGLSSRSGGDVVAPTTIHHEIILSSSSSSQENTPTSSSDTTSGISHHQQSSSKDDKCCSSSGRLSSESSSIAGATLSGSLDKSYHKMILSSSSSRGAAGGISQQEQQSSKDTMCCSSGRSPAGTDAPDTPSASAADVVLVGEEEKGATLLGQAASPQTDKGLSTGAAVGIATAVVIVTVVVVIVAFMYVNKRRKSANNSDHTDMTNLADSSSVNNSPRGALAEEPESEIVLGERSAAPADRRYEPSVVTEEEMAERSGDIPSPDLPKGDGEISMRGLHFEDI